MKNATKEKYQKKEVPDASNARRAKRVLASMVRVICALQVNFAPVICVLPRVKTVNWVKQHRLRVVPQNVRCVIMVNLAAAKVFVRIVPKANTRTGKVKQNALNVM